MLEDTIRAAARGVKRRSVRLATQLSKAIELAHNPLFRRFELAGAEQRRVCREGIAPDVVIEPVEVGLHDGTVRFGLGDGVTEAGVGDEARFDVLVLEA